MSQIEKHESGKGYLAVWDLGYRNQKIFMWYRVPFAKQVIPSLFTDPLFCLQSPSSAGEPQGISRALASLADVFRKIKQRLCTG